MRLIFAIILFGSCCNLYAQQDLIYVKLTEWARDDRFEKMELVLPLFVMANDTIESNDFENLTEAKKIKIIKPSGFKTYAYGYLYFQGVPNANSPGYINILVANYDMREPKLFVDRNNNYNFTDDGLPAGLPMIYNVTDTALIQLNRLDKTDAGVAVKLSRFSYMNKHSYKKLLGEHYEFYYPTRKFAGVDHCFREQRYITRSGIVKYGTDSFRVALFDGNNNGLYNDSDTDKVITANMADSIFDSRDDLRAFTITSKREDMFIEKDGEQFEILQIDPSGQYMVLKSMKENLLMGRIPEGKKVPKFKFIDWEGKVHKFKKLRKKDVFIYFTGPHAKTFAKDTATLRELAARFPDKLQVIGFIDVNKSYELKIFGMYSNLNWIAAYKNKDINRMLKVRGLPSSLWIARKRKLVKYNISPQEFLRVYSEQQNKGGK